MVCCLPRVRPALLAASEFAQDLTSSPRVRPAVSNFIVRPENLPSLPCLLYSQLHGCEDLSMVCLFLVPYHLPLFVVLACSVTGPPGFCLHHPPVFNYRCTCCHGVRGGDTGSPAFSFLLLSLSPLSPCRPVEPLPLPSCHSLQVPLPVLVHAA